MLSQRGLAAKAVIRRQSFDLGPLLHHPFEGNQAGVAEQPQDLGDQPAERLRVAGAEIRQAVIVDGFQPGQPLIGRMILTPTGDLPGRADPSAIGVYPQAGLLFQFDLCEGGTAGDNPLTP